MAAEAAEFPADGIEYRFLTVARVGSPLVKSPIKGFMSRFDTTGCDIIESLISPVHTDIPWVYSLACIEEALAFNLLHVPLPRTVRSLYLRWLFTRHNFRRFLFWSQAGRQSLDAYPVLNDARIREKAEVVYPAVRRVEDHLVRFNEDRVNILFSGDFFRKGGVNVVDAFERLSATHPDVTLRICSDERIDFNTGDTRLRAEYLGKIQSHRKITFGRITRAEMIGSVLPETDIYLLPTYQEAFGFAILEAMAFGIPVIATNIMAIPELIEDGGSGFLIDTSGFNCTELFRGYVVNRIPDDFRTTVTDALYGYLVRLVESPALRRQMGTRGIALARSRFSFEERNRTMKRIYEDALR